MRSYSSNTPGAVNRKSGQVRPLGTGLLCLRGKTPISLITQNNGHDTLPLKKTEYFIGQESRRPPVKTDPKVPRPLNTVSRPPKSLPSGLACSVGFPDPRGRARLFHEKRPPRVHAVPAPDTHNPSISNTNIPYNPGFVKRLSTGISCILKILATEHGRLVSG